MSIRTMTVGEASKIACWKHAGLTCAAMQCMAWQPVERLGTERWTHLKDQSRAYEGYSTEGEHNPPSFLENDFYTPSGEGWVFYVVDNTEDGWKGIWTRDKANAANERSGYCAALNHPAEIAHQLACLEKRLALG